MCTWLCDAYIVVVSRGQSKRWTRTGRLEQSQSHSLQARQTRDSIARMISGVLRIDMGSSLRQHYRRDLSHTNPK
jgi:hypothetical protein